MTKTKDEFTRAWIIENALPIIDAYYGQLTLRGLHYQLVAQGMTNTIQHYKRVVAAMTAARWAGTVDFNAFLDHDRETLGGTAYQETTVEGKTATGKWAVEHYLTQYSKNRWENQPYYVEVFIEKKALIGAFQGVCSSNSVALNPCKGYPSLTFLNDVAARFKEASDEGKIVTILYFGDYDPSGEDIPRSIQETLERLDVRVDVKRVALMEDQVEAWNLPPAPAKVTDTRTAAWDGIGQVELDAVKPDKLQALCQDAINAHFDQELYEDLEAQEEEERIEYVATMKAWVAEL